MNQKHSYSSTQIDFCPESAKEFLSLRKSLISKADLYKPDSMGLSEDPHVTILYGIHQKSPSLELTEIIETYPKFVVTLGNVSLFKADEQDNDFDVVKVDIHCTDLFVLNHAFRQVCDYTLDYPDYIPHATVGFVKPETCSHLEGLDRFKGICFLANKITFSGSDGSKRFLFLGRK